MTVRTIVAIVVVVALVGGSIAQDSCEQAALAHIDRARAEYTGDINALFSAIDIIEADWRACQNNEPQTEMSVVQTEMSASEVVDGGHIFEGLWEFTTEYVLSDACDERRKQVTYEFYEDVYYGNDGLLVWDAGTRYTNFKFEYLLAQRYTRNQEFDRNWVFEYEIMSATATTMSGTYVGYWQGNKDVWCTFNGTFSGGIFDAENACLVEGNANIRTSPFNTKPKKRSC